MPHDSRCLLRSPRMDVNADRASKLEPPDRTRVGTDYGFACDPNVTLVANYSAKPRVRHEGCVGWWRSPSDLGVDGWRCACACHERGAGWPGYAVFSGSLAGAR